MFGFEPDFAGQGLIDQPQGTGLVFRQFGPDGKIVGGVGSYELKIVKRDIFKYPFHFGKGLERIGKRQQAGGHLLK